MYIQLMHRHHGVHNPIKHIEINIKFEDVYIKEDNIDEELLLSAIPDGFLPVSPSLILLAVGEEWGSTGQRNLKNFRNWAKYFDSYVLEIYKEPLPWWREGRGGGD